MSAAPEIKKLDSIKHHRRQTLRWLVLPAVGIGAGFILLVLALVLPFSPIRLRQDAQVSIIANWMMMCCVLLPIMLCGFLVYVVLMAATFGMNWVHGMTAGGMRKVQTTSRTIADKTASAADNLNRKSIGFNTRFAFLDSLLKLFDRRQKRESEQKDVTTSK
ncbi:MAG: hypothetical protein H7Y09_02095 [Chitinophagaceae bacterium]|nr:hypothetical protein [Anaerolineae bacterium]